MNSKIQPEPEIVSREFVKPFSPKIHPKIHNFSFFDHFSLNLYVPLLYFYTTKNGEPENHISSVLKLSLSAALSHYYPLAGRIKDHVNVDCNNEGALFLEGRIECNVSEFLSNPDGEILKLLFPDSLCFKDSSRNGPVAVQVTYFTCGGMSIGICLCHKTLDMASMSTFIREWSSLARISEEKISPEFDIGSLYHPPLDLLKRMHGVSHEMKGCVSRRVVFDGSKIAELKEMVADKVPNPTRVEVVASLLSKSAILANAKENSAGCIKPSVMKVAMNLRTKVSPPLSDRSIGNMSWCFELLARDDREIELGVLVKEFRKGKTQFSNSCANVNSREDLCSMLLESMKPVSEYMNVEHEVYVCTSWCNYPFYESDFGWGKPLWIASLGFKIKNVMVLMDTKEGNGIEAFICLEEKAMVAFENNQELLSFSRVNPSVV